MEYNTGYWLLCIVAQCQDRDTNKEISRTLVKNEGISWMLAAATHQKSENGAVNALLTGDALTFKGKRYFRTNQLSFQG